MKYFKILNELEKHNDYHYISGLNVDVVEFDDSDRECVRGGLYYSNADNILNFLDYGIFIREVEIPKNAKTINFKTKSRSDRIILKERRDLRKVDAWEWLITNGVDIRVNNAIVWASAGGYVDVAQLLINSGATISSWENALRIASAKGHIDIVKLLISSGVDVRSGNDCSIKLAVKNGHTEIVKLLLDAGSVI